MSGRIGAGIRGHEAGDAGEATGRDIAPSGTFATTRRRMPGTRHRSWQRSAVKAPSNLKLDRDRAGTALDRTHVVQQPPSVFGPELIDQFGRLMRENLTAGTIPFRKAWSPAIVDRIELDDVVIRIAGHKTNVAQAPLAEPEQCLWFAVLDRDGAPRCERFERINRNPDALECHP